MISPARLAGAAMFAMALAGPAFAADYENPPVFKASALLGADAEGPGYQVEETVGSDGYLRIYNVQTPWGRVEVHGDQMMNMRIKEIQALDAMDKTSQSQEFGDALVRAGLKPVEFAGNLVTHPVDTVKNTVSGVGKLFGSIGSGIRNAGKSQDNMAESVSGAAKQRRLIAYDYGIDPYTDLPPLKEKLDQMSRAAAAGGLAVTGAFILIPGVAGTAISNVSGAQSMNEMVRDDSAAELMDANRKTLLRIGVTPDLVEELLANPNFTPTDMTAFAGALGSMGELQNIDVLISRAAAATSRDTAFFMRRNAELMSARQAEQGDITGFVSLPAMPLPIATSRDDGLIAVFALDTLAWTKANNEAITALSGAARAQGMGGPFVLSITGSATPLARQQLATLGWQIEQADQ